MIEAWAVRDAVEDVFGPGAKATVYLVVGLLQRPYVENSSTWHVGVYVDRQVAVDRAAVLNAWCVANGVHTTSPRSGSGSIGSGTIYVSVAEPVFVTPKTCPLDPDFRTDYYGTEYAVREVTIHF